MLRLRLVMLVLVLSVLLSVALLLHQTALVVRTDVAPLPQKPRPHLDPHYTEDEEDEEAEEEDVTEHGESVKKQHDKDPHA